ncbi:hypothetical protein WN51_08591 [Melipona quadrifasciata]|uniref:Uncharacterized protein n=1 Tax=Melipona quadrifasciata TaxID=166423 RepID=A0A0N0U6T8_9HYME|nr:hypothetical protein WN51_08591 [Melipona quadrifasciata]
MEKCTKSTRNVQTHRSMRPRIPQIRVSNTRLAQAASGCAPSVDVLPIFDVKQQSVWNPARMGATSLVGLVLTSVWGKESLPSAPLMSLGSDFETKRKNYIAFSLPPHPYHSHSLLKTIRSSIHTSELPFTCTPSYKLFPLKGIKLADVGCR